MKNLPVISASFLAVFLLYFGCKEEEQLVSSKKSEISAEEQVEGRWVIDSLSLSSVNIPSFCHQIGEGAIFEFTENDSLKIYPKDAMEACDRFSYTAQDDLIQIIKDDMIMLVEYKLKTDSSLVLKSKTFFRWQEDAVTDSVTHQLLLKEGVSAFLTKI